MKCFQQVDAHRGVTDGRSADLVERQLQDGTMRWSLGINELTVPLAAHRLRRQVSVEDLSEDIGDVEDRVLGGGRIVYARRKCDQRDVGKLAYAVAGVLLHGPGRADQHRLRRWFSREEVKVLLVAGGATGVAAIFKAPATGALFAMEVPFQADLARRPPLSFRDLAAAGCIGLLAGVGARGFAALVRVAKERSAQIHPVGRVVAAGAVIGALILVSEALTGETLALGPGYRTIAWTFEADHAIGVVLAMLVIRGTATVAAVGGGGVGGLFIPLAIEGPCWVASSVDWWGCRNQRCSWYSGWLRSSAPDIASRSQR